MLSRTWNALLVLGVLLSAGPALAQTKIRYLLTVPTPGVSEAVHSSVPQALGFWKEAGLDVTVTPFNGSTGATQVVISGAGDFLMGSPEALLVGKQEGADIKGIYNHARQAIYTIAVIKDSPIKNLADFKGKTIGVVSLSSGATSVAKAMLRSAGMDPEKDVKWLPIGLGPQSIASLKANQVDAIAMWDWAYAIFENAGVSFRHFETEGTAKLLSIMLIANGNFIKNNPDATTKFAEGIAKSVVFTLANPEAAVRIHWDKYPASKPANMPEDQALREAIHVLEARLPKYRLAGLSDPRFGAFEKSEWEVTQAFFVDVGVLKNKADVNDYFTNSFVDRVNSFDKAAIESRARAYR